jgi:hypothetical protein
MIEFAPMTSGDTVNAAYAPIDSTELIRNAVGVSFDYSAQLVFYSDIQLRRIVAVKFDGSQHFTIAESTSIIRYQRCAVHPPKPSGSSQPSILLKFSSV